MPGPEGIGDARSAREELSAQTVALRLLVGLLVIGAAWWLSGLLIPSFLAAILAIALSPLAERLERAGLPKGLAALACMLGVAAILAAAAGLLMYQAGRIVEDSDRYIDRFGSMLAQGVRRAGGEAMVESLGLIEAEGTRGGSTDRRETARETPPGEEGDGSGAGHGAGAPNSWGRFLRANLQAVGRWVVTGLGGLLGLLGGLVVFLAFLFFLLQTRSEWLERVTDGLRRLGLRPSGEHLERLRHEVVTYLGCLSMVSLGYMVIVSLALWAIGVPQPLLWGLLAGMMEFIPYFGPLVASVLPTIVALSQGHWWQPAATLALFLGLHLCEGYVVTPLLYGRAVRFNPVTILFGSLFFGWIWGPLGLAMAMPMMILLRGLLVMSPDTPALDAFADVEQEKGEQAVSLTGSSGRSVAPG